MTIQSVIMMHYTAAEEFQKDIGTMFMYLFGFGSEIAHWLARSKRNAQAGILKHAFPHLPIVEVVTLCFNRRIETLNIIVGVVYREHYLS